MHWLGRAVVLLMGLVAAAAALITAGKAEQHLAVELVVVGTVLAAAVATVVGVVVLRRKVRAGWRPAGSGLGSSAAAGIGTSGGLLLARLAPPEVAAPVLALAAGVLLGGAVAPRVPEIPGWTARRTEERDRAPEPWSPNPFAADHQGLRFFAGAAYGFALVCLVFVVIGPVRPEDTRTGFLRLALLFVAIGVGLTALSWLWHQLRTWWRHRRDTDAPAPADR